MAHKTEGGDCPLTVNAIIRKRAKDENISLSKMITKTSEEINIPEKTIEKWVWPKKKDAHESAPKNGGASNALRKHTKPQVKIQLNDTIVAIDKGQVSDDDLKSVIDKVAEKVEKGEASARVLSKSKTTFKKSGRTYSPAKTKQESEIIKMVNLFHKFLDKLDAVRGKGAVNISKADRETKDQEFKLMVPR